MESLILREYLQGLINRGGIYGQMDRPRNFYKNTFHHLYNRGANKQKIFFEKENYYYFLRRVKYYKNKYSIRILAYCLMPNHFHIYVEQLTYQFPISIFISSLLNSYTKSMNKRYNRSGTFFEGKTKSKQIQDDSYFKWIIKYILENPVKTGLCFDVDDWEFSSARDLLNKRIDGLTDINEIATYFDSKEQMQNFIFDKSINVNYEF